MYEGGGSEGVDENDSLICWIGREDFVAHQIEYVQWRKSAHEAFDSPLDAAIFFAELMRWV